MVAAWLPALGGCLVSADDAVPAERRRPDSVSGRAGSVVRAAA
jgi:hypothetical protein